MFDYKYEFLLLQRAKTKVMDSFVKEFNDNELHYDKHSPTVCRNAISCDVYMYHYQYTTSIIKNT